MLEIRKYVVCICQKKKRHDIYYELQFCRDEQWSIVNIYSGVQFQLLFSVFPRTKILQKAKRIYFASIFILVHKS